MTMLHKPSYKDDRKIETTAYAGPRRAGKRNYDGVYGANPRDTKEDYPSFFTDEVFELYKKAGLSFLLPEGDAYYQRRCTENGIVRENNFEKSDLFTYMKLAEKHGLDVYPAIEEVEGELTHTDAPFGEKEKALIRRFVEELQQHFPDTFKGIMLTDEPRQSALGNVKKIVEYLHSEEIQRIKPDLEIFSSMFPIYAQLYCLHPKYPVKNEPKIFFDEERKEAYRYYVELCGKTLGEFTYDYYPFVGDNLLSVAFYQNLEVAAQIGKEKNFPISITLLSCRMDSGYNEKTGRGRIVYRNPSYEDMRWQVYSSLAFGVQKIGYFTFWQHYNESPQEVFPKAMINYEPSSEKGYRKTELYDHVAEINREIQSIDHIFLRFKWQGCSVIKKSRSGNVHLVEGGYKDNILKKVKATKDTLIGYFENPEDRARGYWLVNAHNPYYYQTNDIELTFQGATGLLYYREGKEYDVPLEETFSIRLGVGEGIFMIPYNHIKREELV